MQITLNKNIMKFNLEIMLRDVVTLSIALAGIGKLLEINPVDENKKEGIDKVRVKVEIENAQLGFWVGKKFQQLREPFTEEEREALQARYEYENDL